MIGDKYHHLTIISEPLGVSSYKYVDCQCNCGNITRVTTNNVFKGNTRSCGCLRKIGLKYAPNTGMFYRDGRPVLNISKAGYRTIQYRGKAYYAHRLAWLLIYKEEVPKGMDIDHINRVKLDNRISNLRVVTRKENLQNTTPRKNCTNGKELEIVELHKQGMSTTEIGKKLGSDRHYISTYLKKQGFIIIGRNQHNKQRKLGE